MGLGIGLIAPLPRQGGRPMAWPKFQQLVADALEGTYLALNEGEDGFELEVHPGAECLRFTPEGDDGFYVETKTSTLGPGYHAHIVEMIDEIGKVGKVELDWGAGEGGDETNYAVDRDFAELQSQMAEQFRALIDVMSDRSAEHALFINWSFGVPEPIGDAGGLFTPSGLLSTKWCREVAEGKDLGARCREFYVWWDKDRDADYWRKLARMTLWSEVRWRPPMSEREARVWATALLAADELEELGAAHLLPAAEIAELRELMEWDEDTPCREPSPKGIGYYRHNVRWHLPGGWAFVLGGYFFEEIEEDDSGGQTLLWFFNDRTVRFSSANIETDSGPAPAAELLEFATSQAAPDAETIELNLGPATARGYFATESDEESGEEYNVLSVTIAIDGRVAWLTITFGDPQHRDWAMDIARSVVAPADGD